MVTVRDNPSKNEVNLGLSCTKHGKDTVIDSPQYPYKRRTNKRNNLGH